jgi:hypothetical protein
MAAVSSRPAVPSGSGSAVNARIIRRRRITSANSIPATLSALAASDSGSGADLAKLPMTVLRRLEESAGHR